MSCFSQKVQDKVQQLDLRRLQIAANVIAGDLHKAGLGNSLELAPAQTSEASKVRSEARARRKIK